MADGSQFEQKFDLAPATDVEARLDRAEALIGLFISAATNDGDVSLARMWVGTFAPTKERLPLPSPDAIETVLNEFRGQEYLQKKRAEEDYYTSQGLNPDGSNIS